MISAASQPAGGPSCASREPEVGRMEASPSPSSLRHHLLLQTSHPPAPDIGQLCHRISRGGSLQRCEHNSRRRDALPHPLPNTQHADSSHPRSPQLQGEENAPDPPLPSPVGAKRVGRKQHRALRSPQFAVGALQEHPHPTNTPQQTPGAVGHPKISGCSRARCFSAVEPGGERLPPRSHARQSWQWRQGRLRRTRTPPTPAPGLTALPSNAPGHAHTWGGRHEERGEPHRQRNP